MRTAYTIVRRHQINPQPNRWGGFRGRRMDEEMTNTAVAIVEEHPAMTLNQINHELRLRLPQKPSIGRTTLSAALKSQLIVMKKLEDAPSQRNTDDTKRSRQQFAEWMMNEGTLARGELVFIDETGFNLHCARTRGRAHRGERAVRVVNGRRGGNYTLCLAISNTRGLIFHTLQDRGMTAEKFIEFLEAVSARSSPDSALLFDNAAAHRRALTERGPRLQPQQIVKAIPPYSPMLNIVENAISTFKAALKRDLEAERPSMLEKSHQDQMIQLAIMSELLKQRFKVFDRKRDKAGFDTFKVIYLLVICFETSSCDLLLRNIYLSDLDYSFICLSFICDDKSYKVLT